MTANLGKEMSHEKLVDSIYMEKKVRKYSQRYLTMSAE